MLADRQLLVGGLVRSRSLAAQAVDVIMPSAQSHGVALAVLDHRLDREARVVNRSGEGPDQVGGEAAQVVEQDRVLLVQFCVEQQPALLRQDARVLTGEAARETREIAVHEWSP